MIWPCILLLAVALSLSYCDCSKAIEDDFPIYRDRESSAAPLAGNKGCTRYPTGFP